MSDVAKQTPSTLVTPGEITTFVESVTVVKSDNGC